MKLFNIFNKKNTKAGRVGLFIIGAQKCGTTSLHSYLSQHVNIIGSSPKEIDFFSYDNNYIKGLKWYHKHFDLNLVNENKYLLDSSVEYMYIPNTWQRILKYNPQAKLIVLLRNPIERAYSAYYMYKRLSEGHGLKYYENHLKDHSSFYKARMLKVLKNPDFHSFEEYVKIEMKIFNNSQDNFWYEPSFLNRGLYYHQLKPFYENFKHENILIVDSQKFKLNKEKILSEILQWLELDLGGDFNLEQDHLVGNYKRKDSSELNQMLNFFFNDYNDKLYELINQDFKWN